MATAFRDGVMTLMLAQMGVVFKVFGGFMSLTGAAGGGAMSMVTNPMGQLKGLYLSGKRFALEMKSSIWSDVPRQKIRLRRLKDINRLSCRPIQVVQGVSAKNGNLYLDSQGEVCFEVAPAGRRGTDSSELVSDVVDISVFRKGWNKIFFFRQRALQHA